MLGDLRKEGLVGDMKPKLIGETYMRFSTEKSTRKYRYGLYECVYCNKEFEGCVNSVKRGKTKSCGCLRGGVHGLKSNRFYSTWYNMVHRCNNVNNKDYKIYGGRGIKVCEEWLDIKNFVAWCEATHPNLEGYTLDRIDTAKGYSPENCTWSDKTTQCVNQRMKKNNTSGFVGVSWSKTHQFWVSYIHLNKKRYNVGSFKTKEEAVLARDNYIIENGLPHKLSTDYIKQEKINE